MKRVRKIRIPLKKLQAGAVTPYTLLDESDQVILITGRVVSELLLRKLKQRGMHHVVAEIVENEKHTVAAQDISPEIKTLALDRLEDTLTSLSRHQPTSLMAIEDSVHDITREVIEHQELVIPISQLQKHNDYTFTHSLNVTVIALLLGKYLNLNEKNLVALGMGAMFHDLGKLSIPLDILDKPGKLTDPEFQIMKQHPLFAQEILDENTNLSDQIKNVVAQHHEKTNGTGYPLGITHRNMDCLSCVVAVADVYDALTSNRSYRQAMPVAEALEYLMGNAGLTLDERVVIAFVRHLSPYQVGEEVLLSTGDYARITGINPIIPFRPVVTIEGDLHEGGTTPAREIDLSRNLTTTIVASA